MVSRIESDSGMDMDWYTILLGGLASGLVLAYVADVVVFKFRHWAGGQKSTDVYFSPKGGCVSAIVAELTKARSAILVQAYSFTCRDIANALIAAVKRGVSVTILLDKSNEAESYSALGDLEGHGIDVRIDGVHAIAHNKVMVIDSRTVLTGSFNFTQQAEHENAENLIVMRNQPELAVLYHNNFAAHAKHCHAPASASAAESQKKRFNRAA